MSRYHRCDHRSDYQCEECERDQVAYEREAEASEEPTVKERLLRIRDHAGDIFSDDGMYLGQKIRDEVLAILAAIG